MPTVSKLAFTVLKRAEDENERIRNKTKQERRSGEDEKEQLELLKKMQKETGSLRLGDTGYTPSMLNWALSGGVAGGALGGLANIPSSVMERSLLPSLAGIGLGTVGGAGTGALAAFFAKRKLDKLRGDSDEALPSKWESFKSGAGWGGGLGALLGGGLGVATNPGADGTMKHVGKGSLGGAAAGALLGGALNMGLAASERTAARRAGLMRGKEDNGLGGRLIDKLLGGHSFWLDQAPQYD